MSEKSGLMDFAQNHVARRIDAAHVFGIATVVRMVGTRSLPEGMHEHIMGNLLDRLLLGIDNVFIRHPPGNGFSCFGGRLVQIPRVKGLGAIVCIIQLRVSEPRAIACEHGMACCADSQALILSPEVIAYHHNAGREQEELAVYPMWRRKGRETPSKSQNSDDGKCD